MEPSEAFPIVKVENIDKVYRIGKTQIYALRGITMGLQKGEFVAIMGPSGSGKTTLLNIMGALDRPTRGKIYIEGKDLTKLSEGELSLIRRDKIGFVFQFYNLISVLTAQENIELPMLIAGVPKEKRTPRVQDLLKMVGLFERAEHKPDELSGGEQQRVAIARAMANNPIIILADEPTGDLDIETSKEVMSVLRDLAKREGVSVVVVTHNPVVAKLADRILQIRNGKII